MENLIDLTPFMAVAVGGQLVHILAKLSKLEKRKDFSFKIWLSKNGFTTALGVVSAIVGVFVLEDTITYATAITGGYMVDSLLKNAKSSKG